jgi:hypothetical protein
VRLCRQPAPSRDPQPAPSDQFCGLARTTWYNVTGSGTPLSSWLPRSSATNLAGDLRRCAAGSRNPPRRTTNRDYSALAAAVKAANLTKLAAFAAAETAKQAAIEKARDTPHATGDNAAV